MKVQFWGAARTVTGSCYLIEHQGCRFLVDCGMFQGSKVIKENNYGDFPFNVTDLDFMILTHAHIDHSGLIPKLYKQGFQGPIYATDGTVDLCSIMLPDSGHIQEMEVERKNRKLTRAGQKLLEPIYTADDALQAQALFRAKDYEEAFYPAKDICVRFHDAGHILGSALVDIRYQEDGMERKLVFTGDLGRENQAIVKDPTPIERADFLVMESTYGNRLHQGGMVENAPLVADVINQTLRQGGNVIIPAFAVDRTQDILMMIYFMQEAGVIDRNAVYVDSPLAVKATEIFAKYPEYFDEVTTACYQEKGHVPFILPNLTYVRTAEESQRLNGVKQGAIIISASGMADAGRIKHHLKHNLWRKECAVLFIGYQAEGTLGRRLVDGEQRVTIHGEQVEVKARIVNLDGFSAHADKSEMLHWLGHFQQLPQRIFVTHGEESSALEFAQLLTETLHVDTEVPEMGDLFELTLDGAPLLAHERSFASAMFDENLLVEINTALQRLTLTQDYEKLMRIRDFLRQVV